MNQAIVIIFRWLAWLLLVSFESVVGFPWLSLYLVGEWLLKPDSSMVMAGLLLMAVIISAAYGVPLTLAAAALLLLWQAVLRTRSNSWARWASYGAAALVIGIAAGTPLNFLTLSLTGISLLIFLKLSGGNFSRKSWQKTKRLPSSAA